MIGGKGKRFEVVYDLGHTIDGFYVDTMGEASNHCSSIYESWIDEFLSEEAINGKNDDGWNEMIETCSCLVCQLNDETGEYEEFWGMSDEELENIGWVERQQDTSKIDELHRAVVVALKLYEYALSTNKELSGADMGLTYDEVEFLGKYMSDGLPENDSEAFWGA